MSFHPAYAGDLTPEQTWNTLETDDHAVLIDVRTEGEWRTIGVPDTSSTGRPTLFIEWATPLGPNPDFARELQAAGLDKDAPLLFLCRSGGRSVGAAIDATGAGFTNAFNVLEGFEGELDHLGRRTLNGWLNAGLPTTAFTDR